MEAAHLSHPLPSPDEIHTDSRALNVWGRIVSELADLQGAAPPESPGSVVNPICGRPYVVDTCCGAAVFAAEYRRTAADEWRTRASQALTAALSGAFFQGIAEPTWDVFGWHDVPKSLPATAIAVDAYRAALAQLDLVLDRDLVSDLSVFLSTCRTTKGGFAHNPPAAEQTAADVQNATASALDLTARLISAKDPVSTDLDATLLRLQRGQLESGFWPYSYPGRRLRLKQALERLHLEPLLAHTRFLSHDSPGDIMHHLTTLYFASGYAAFSKPEAAREMLASGWDWIRKRLVDGGDGTSSIDWTGEPIPRSPQYSNARDTNAYFLILGALPQLVLLGVVDAGESLATTKALLTHVDANLMSAAESTPCVIPYEGPLEIGRNILPMFEQSVAWKGQLMADVILGDYEAT
jgi:hypothetical protein